MKALIFCALATACTLLASTAQAQAQDHLVWFSLKTTEGCVYYSFAFPNNVAPSKRDTTKVEWFGPPCAPGKPVEGKGSIKTTMLQNGMLWWLQTDAMFIGGVPDGATMLSSSFHSKPRPALYRRGCKQMEDGGWNCPPGPPPSLVGGAGAGNQTNATAALTFKDERRFCEREMNSMIADFLRVNAGTTQEQAADFATRRFYAQINATDEGLLRQNIQRWAGSTRPDNQLWVLDLCAAKLSLGRLVGIKQAQQRARHESVDIESLVEVIPPGSPKSANPGG